MGGFNCTCLRSHEIWHGARSSSSFYVTDNLHLTHTQISLRFEWRTKRTRECYKTVFPLSPQECPSQGAPPLPTITIQLEVKLRGWIFQTQNTLGLYKAASGSAASEAPGLVLENLGRWLQAEESGSAALTHPWDALPWRSGILAFRKRHFLTNRMDD